MKNYLPVVLFVVVEILVVCFILVTVGAMPKHIASHFDGAGQPNDFMSNTGYVVFMITFVIGIPGVIVLPVVLAFDFALPYINIPNKEYWLSEHNKSRTVQSLKNHMAYFGIIICLFIGYVHWLLIKANETQPARLANDELFIGMAIFILSLITWGLYLALKFKRIP